MTLEMIQAAIAEGSISAGEDTVKIAAKTSPDGKDHVATYTRYTALNAKGMAALCNGKIAPSTAKPESGKDERTDADKAAGACDYFNYGFDLDARATVRAKLMGELEGPEKAIAKAVKSLVDGAGYSEQDAREIVINGRKAKGLAV